MNNEIKVIERILATSKKYITYAERCYVLDYITNLQEETERQSKAQIILDNMLADYKSRIDKAIEYINENIIYDTYRPHRKVLIIPNNLLNILNGGDENDN